MGKKGKTVGKGGFEHGTPTPEVEVSVEQREASAFLAAAEGRIRAALVAIMKLGKDGVLEASGVKRVHAELDQADTDALALIDLIQGSVKLDVRNFINSYNRFITWIGNKAPREGLKPIDLAFFGLTEESFENSGVASREGSNVGADGRKKKKNEGEKESTAFKAIEGLASRITGEAKKIRGSVSSARSRVDVVAAGPFSVRTGLIESLGRAVTNIEEKATELDALRDRAAELLTEARTADESRCSEIFAEIQAMPFADLARDANLSVEYTHSGVKQERQRVGAEIQDIFQSLSVAKQIEGNVIIGKIKQAIKTENDKKLMDLLAEMEALAQAPEPEEKVHVGDAQKKEVNLPEILAFFARAKGLIDKAKANDGKVDTKEAAEIFRTLTADIEAIGGSRVQGGVSQVRDKYRALIAAIQSVPLAEAFLRSAYPEFFFLFQEQGKPGAAASPDAAETARKAAEAEAARIAAEAAAQQAAAEAAARATAGASSAGAGTSAASDASASGPDVAGDKKKERVEMSREDVQKIRDFTRFVKRLNELYQDPRYKTETRKKYTQDQRDDFDEMLEDLLDLLQKYDPVEIAQILVTARRKRMIMPDGLSQAARAAFFSFFGGDVLSPEKYLDEYRKAAERDAAGAAAASGGSGDSVEAGDEGASGSGESAKDKSGDAPSGDAADPSSDDFEDADVPPGDSSDSDVDPDAADEASSTEDDEMPEDDEVSDEDINEDLGEDFGGPEASREEKRETGTEEQRERRTRVDAFLAGLSAQDFWRDDVVGLTEDEKSLFAYKSDALRRNYVRVQLFLGGEEEGIFFDRLVAQSRNPDEARRILRAILAEIKNLSVEQRREIFAEEIVTVEAEWEEDEGPEAPDPDKKRGPDPDAPPPPPEPEAPKDSSAPEPDPEPSPEPGPVPPPDADAGTGKKAPEAEKETVWARMRNWAKQKRGEFEDSDVYRVHMKGEKTRAEMDGSSATLSRPAMITGAILSAALSYSGGALFADLPRYMGQRYYTRVERDEISTAFKAALDERRKRESGAPESAGVKERSDALRKRVFASRYLTNPQKQELFIKLKGREDSFVDITSPYDEHLNREVGRILENAIRTRVSEEKVLKEATNMLFAVSGANFLRAPAYGAISLYERWSRLTRETPESKAGDRLRATVAGGFDEYWDKAKGKKGRLAQAAALGTAFRFVGMSATLVESVASSAFVGDLLHAWEHKEAAYPSDASDLSHQSIDEINERIQHAKTESWTNVLPNVLTERRDEMLEPDSYTFSGEPDDALHTEIPDVLAERERVEIPEPSVSIQPDYAPDVDESSVIDDDFEPVPGGDSDAVSLPDEIAPDVDVLPEPEVIMSPDQIPTEALVGIDGAHNGITQALLSAVEARPSLLHSAERAALGDDYTAALLMRRMAAKDGLLDYWISAKAVGKLAIVPKYEADGAHIAFLNPETGTAYSVDELKDLGWLMKAPK